MEYLFQNRPLGFTLKPMVLHVEIIVSESLSHDDVLLLN